MLTDTLHNLQLIKVITNPPQWLRVKRKATTGPVNNRKTFWRKIRTIFQHWPLTTKTKQNPATVLFFRMLKEIGRGVGGCIRGFFVTPAILNSYTHSTSKLQDRLGLHNQRRALDVKSFSKHAVITDSFYLKCSYSTNDVNNWTFLIEIVWHFPQKI